MPKAVEHWNVVATAYDREFDEASRLLAPFGSVGATDYFNVLVMRVGDVTAFLDALEETIRRDASIPNAVARIVPVTRKFTFESAEEFEHKARAAVEEWLPELEDKSFHVRMHRRGFKGRLSSQHEERSLGRYLIERLGSVGSTGRIAFEDPDAIIVVETLGQAAGLSHWTRRQLRDHALLRLD